MSHFDILALEAELLTIDFKNMLVAQGKANPERTGMHASSVLQTEGEWCTRREVLHHLYPEQTEQGEGWKSWDWRRKAIFENGWDLHRRWQRLFREQGNVVYSPVPFKEHQGDWLTMIDGQWCAPELDLTHFDPERNLYFSPDAILEFGGMRYVVEIKGIKQEAYLELTDDLLTAIKVNETVYKARLQVNLYMHLLGLSRGIILVENKNTCDFKLWVVLNDPELITTQVERIYAVKRDTILARKNGVNAAFPVRKCLTRSDSAAQKCMMREVCFKQEREDW